MHIEVHILYVLECKIWGTSVFPLSGAGCTSLWNACSLLCLIQHGFNFPLRSPGLLIQPTMRSLLLFLSPGRKLPKQPECDTRWVLELRPRRQHIFVASSPALLTPFTFFCRFMSLTALLYWCFTGDEDFMTRLSFFTRFQTIISLFQLNYIKCGSKSGKNCTLYNIHCQTLMYQICRLWRVKGHYCKNNVTSRSSFQTIIEHVLLWFCTFCRFDVIIYKLSYIM